MKKTKIILIAFLLSLTAPLLGVLVPSQKASAANPPVCWLQRDYKDRLIAPRTPSVWVQPIVVMDCRTAQRQGYTGINLNTDGACYLLLGADKDNHVDHAAINSCTLVYTIAQKMRQIQAQIDANNNHHDPPGGDTGGSGGSGGSGGGTTELGCIGEGGGGTNSENDNSKKFDCNTEKNCKGGDAVDPNQKITDCGFFSTYIIPAINFLSVGVVLLVVIMVVIGGIQYSASRDNPQATAAAKGRIINAIIALLLYFFLFAGLQFIVPGGVFN